LTDWADEFTADEVTALEVMAVGQLGVFSHTCVSQFDVINKLVVA
jgi:hypothetical protein